MIDAANLADLLSRPGIDPRSWISLGLVEPDPSASEHSVVFDDEDGNPLDHGVLVSVKLQPSGTKVTCRVGGSCAGNGEGEWHPLGPGDEVLVAIPSGSERAGCVIIERLNQKYDAFPRTVAGMDVTKNNVAFKRTIAPQVYESGTSLMLRVASHGAQLALDPSGSVFLNDGNKSMLSLTPDVVALQLDAEAAGLHLDVSKKRATIFAQSTALVLDDTDSQFQTGGTLSISTGGNGAMNHATSIESVANVLLAFSEAYNAAIAAALTALGASPLTGVAAAAVFTAAAVPATASALLAAAVGAAGPTPLDPVIAAAILAALATPSVPGTPGVAAAGLRI